MPSLEERRLRETAFKQVKNRHPMEMGIQDGKHALNTFEALGMRS